MDNTWENVYIHSGEREETFTTKLTGKDITFLTYKEILEIDKKKVKHFNSKMDKEYLQNDKYTWKYTVLNLNELSLL